MAKIFKKLGVKKYISILLSAVMILTTLFGAIGTIVASAEDTSLLTLNKVAEAVEGEDNTWDITLSVSGKKAITTTEVVMVIDLSTSMKGDKIKNVRNAAKSAASALLANEVTTVSLVTYGKNYSNEGKYTKDTLNALLTAIDNLTHYENTGTNIHAGLYEARQILESSNADRKYVMLMTDGAPTYAYSIEGISININEYCNTNSNNHFKLVNDYGYREINADGSTVYITKCLNAGSKYEVNGIRYDVLIGIGNRTEWTLYRAIPESERKCEHDYEAPEYAKMSDCIVKATDYEADLIKDSGAEIYGIGVGLTTSTQEILKGFTSGDDYVMYATDSAQSISEAFSTIAGKIRNAAESAVVTDPMGECFNLKGMTVDSVISKSQGDVAYNEETDSLTWNIGTIYEGVPATLTYRIVVDPDMLDSMNEDETYPTNKTTTISYINNKGEQATQEFPIPMAGITKASIKVNSIKVDENGDKVGDISTEYVDSNDTLSNEFVNTTFGTHTVTAKDLTADKLVFKGIEYEGNTTTSNSVDVTTTKVTPTKEVTIKYYEKTKSNVVINYYKDSLEGEFLGTDTESLANMEVGSDITLNANLLGQFRPAGYNTGVVADGSATVVNIDDSLNVVNVVYDTKTQLPYEVNYYKDSIAPSNLIGAPVTGVGEFGTQIPVDVEGKAPEGYKVNGTVSYSEGGNGTITEDADLNVVNVVYEKDAFKYVIKYYKDEIKDQDGYLLATVNGDAVTFGDKILAADVDNTYAKPAGYEAGIVSGDLTISANEADNVITVLYSKKAKVGYIIRYYNGSINEDNKLGEEKNENAIFESEIKLTDEELNAKKPEPKEGYNDGVVDEATSAKIVTADINNNVVNVIYTKAVIGYTIKYYKDTVEDNNLIGDPVYAEATYGEGIDITDAINAKKPDFGYKDGEIQAGSATVVSENLEDNVVIVLYEKDSFKYTVNYFLIDNEEAFLTVEDKAEFESDIPYVTKASDLGEDYKETLEGYEAEGVAELDAEGNGKVTYNPDKNIVNVTFDLADVEYTINYFKQVLNTETKELEVESIETLTGMAMNKATVNYETVDNVILRRSARVTSINVDVDKNMPERGYTNQVLVEGPDKLGVNKVDNEINITYQLGKFDVTVEYYFDNVLDEELTETNPEYYGLEVNSYEDKIKDGYEFSSVEGLGLGVSDNVEDNVIKVYYTIKEVPTEKPTNPQPTTEVAADEDVVTKPAPTEDIGEIAADEDFVDIGEVAAEEAIVDVGDVAADTTQTGDNNRTRMIYFMAIMLFAGALVVITSKKSSKED
ncbi:VWA domain-containing protein [Lachnospira multipara]|uniref:VWA domain-containing protein n=1 Tax=Lachnospira multipara TaxID=28051 RepID=UPI00047F259B|nr:VWA domain-containing protein [Lachnospira multipara]